MQTDNSFLNDFAKILTGALGTADGLRQEAMATITTSFEKYIAEAGFVRKEEFDILQQRFELLVQKVKDLEQGVGQKMVQDVNLAQDI